MYWHIVLIVSAMVLLYLHHKRNAADLETRMRQIHQNCVNSSSIFVMLTASSHDIVSQICDLFENAHCPYSVYVACVQTNGNLREALAQRLQNRHQPDELVANVRVGQYSQTQSIFDTLLQLHHNENHLLTLNANQTAVYPGWDTSINAMASRNNQAAFSWYAPPKGTIKHNMHFWPRNVDSESVHGATVPFERASDYIPMPFATFDVLIGSKQMMQRARSAFPDDMKLTESLHNSNTPIYASSTAYFRKHFAVYFQQLPISYSLSTRMSHYISSPSLWQWISNGLTPNADHNEKRAKHR